MSVTERLAGAADHLNELEVPVPEPRRVLRRARRRRGAVFAAVLAAVVLGGVGVVATSRTDDASVATQTSTTQTQATSTPSPDTPLGLSRSDAFWPDVDHRPDSPIALGREFAAEVLGWGDSADVELVCLGKRDFTDNIGDVARHAWGIADDCQLGTGNDGKMVKLRISSRATGASVDAVAFPTNEAADSGWAFIKIGDGSPRVSADGPDSAILGSPPYRCCPWPHDFRWWAKTGADELFGAVPAGGTIRIPASADRIASVLIVFVDDQGNAFGAQGGGVGGRTSGVTCCTLDGSEPPQSAAPMQFFWRRAVLAPPRADDRWKLGPDGVLNTVHLFSRSAPLELAVGRYTDLDGGLADRLVWVVIEHDTPASPGRPPIDVVHVLDADTGEELVFFGGPAELSTCPIPPGTTPWWPGCFGAS